MNLHSFCSVCLQTNCSLIKSSDTDASNVKWCTRVESIVPELARIEDYLICTVCTKKLEEFHGFRCLLLEFRDRWQSRELKGDEFEVIDNEIPEKKYTKSPAKNEGTSLVCTECNSKFDSKTEVHQHVITHHKEAKMCLLCETFCSNAASLRDHVQIKHERKVSDEKSEDFTAKEDKSELMETTLERRQRGRKPVVSLSCEVCGNSFTYMRNLAEHCTTAHSLSPKTIKPYACAKCDGRFSSLTNLHQHGKYHESTRSKICSLCGKAFKTGSDLMVHEYTHFNRRNYRCKDCDSSFNTNKNLRTHILVVHTDRALWKHHCTLCDKRFPLKSNYDQHRRRHDGERSHVCHICAKSFVSNSELKRHVELHSNIKRFRCVLCEKEYKTRRSHKAHCDSKHSAEGAKRPVREKKFACHVCPGRFYDRQKLHRHLCGHSGVRPFPCGVCDKKFTDKSYLKRHLKVVHGRS